jgi:hypothetical protein
MNPGLYLNFWFSYVKAFTIKQTGNVNFGSRSGTKINGGIRQIHNGDSTFLVFNIRKQWGENL